MPCFVFRLVGMLLLSLLLVMSGCGGGGGGGSKTPTAPDEPAIDTQSIYQPGSPALLETTYESKTFTSQPGTTRERLDDGTEVIIPNFGTAFESTLIRSSTQSGFAQTISEENGVVLTGTTRSLLVRGSGSKEALIAEVVIPRHEAGTINPETISVLRRGPAIVDGEYVEEHISSLPARIDENGNFVILDTMLNEGLAVFIDEETPTDSDDQSDNFESITLSTKANGEHAWEQRSDYILMSFENDLNWNRKPQLIRMVTQPGNAASGYRRPATSQELIELAKKPVCNLVLLVHGHNEEEKGGASVATSEVAPWLFSYKRQVWDLLYQKVGQTISIDGRQESPYPLECTAFYEFIYPTYRPIFSPVSEKTGAYHETLGEALGKAMTETLNSTPQLKAMLDNSAPFNTMIVAHSQGGVVARAGIRHMPGSIKNRINRLVTWGSPHQGAALYTFRYALQSGHDLYVDGWRVPLQSIAGNRYLGHRYRDKLNVLAIDAPGIRDIRWSKDWEHKTRIWSLFPGAADPFSDIEIPVPFFSDNLAAFNANTQEETIAGGYTFITGETSKQVDFEFEGVFETWYFASGLTGIEKGATLNNLVMANDFERVSDGAVPLFSQAASGITFSHPVRVRSMGDVDHEEFYGAEPAQRTSTSLSRGQATATATLEEFALLDTANACPDLTATRIIDDNQAQITGTVIYTLFKNHQGLTIGDYISRIDIRESNQNGRIIGGVNVSVDTAGNFQATVNASDIPDKAVAVAVFKDGSEVSGQISGTNVSILPPRLITYELVGGATETEETFEAAAEPAGSYRYEWDFGDGNRITDTPAAGQNSEVTHTFTNLKDGDEFHPSVKIFDAQGVQLARDDIFIQVMVDLDKGRATGIHNAQSTRFDTPGSTGRGASLRTGDDEYGSMRFMLNYSVDVEWEVTGTDLDQKSEPPFLGYNALVTVLGVDQTDVSLRLTPRTVYLKETDYGEGARFIGRQGTDQCRYDQWTISAVELVPETTFNFWLDAPDVDIAYSQSSRQMAATLEFPENERWFAGGLYLGHAAAYMQLYGTYVRYVGPENCEGPWQEEVRLNNEPMLSGPTRLFEVGINYRHP